MLNKSILMGRLAREPDYQTSGSGTTYCRFTVAVDRDYTKGEDKKTDFIDCIAWRQTADFVSKYFHKGSMIVVSGAINVDTYQKDGENRRSVRVNVEDAYFGESKKSSSAGVDVQVEEPPAQPRDISEVMNFPEVSVTGAQRFIEVSDDESDLPF